MVKETKLVVRRKQALVLVLAVDVHKRFAKGVQALQVHHGVVYVGLCLACPRNDSSYNDSAGVVYAHFLKVRVMFDIEESLYNRLLCACLYHLGISPLSKSYAQGADDYRFARTSLAGEHIEPGLKLYA